MIHKCIALQWLAIAISLKGPDNENSRDNDNEDNEDNEDNKREENDDEDNYNDNRQ